MRTHPRVSLGVLAPEQVGEAAVVLADAFADNPGYRGILPYLTREDRKDALLLVKRDFTAATMNRGVALGAFVDRKLVGVSLVLPPGKYPWGLGGFVGLAKASLHGSTFRAIPALLRYDSWSSKRHMKGPHYYLFVLGVRTDRQGQGIGRALLGDLGKRADADQVPCWLETDKKENLAIYRKAGFEVVHHDKVMLGTEVTMWTMRRDPTPPDEGEDGDDVEEEDES